ncbi:uncharacterized protein [Narcine bancroftii]|uniref:uncharacterized protein n=1 Tax=Narcine bancroftii TaxID=1343680 RepID=UPI003831209A
MQRGIPDNYGHQGFHNPVSQAFNEMPSSNCLPWKALSGSSYSLNVPASINPPDATVRLPYPPNELSSSCYNSSFHLSKLMSTATGDPQSERAAYSRFSSTRNQPTSFQHRSVQSIPSTFQTSQEFVPSQNWPTHWNQDAHRTGRNFPQHQNPASTGMEASAKSFRVTQLRSLLHKCKMYPASEQPPSWSDGMTQFAAEQAGRYWNKQTPNYQQVPIYGSSSHRFNWPTSNAHHHHLEPSQNACIGAYKESIAPNMFETGQQGERIQALQRGGITVPQEPTQNYFMKLRHKEAPMNVQGTLAIGNKPTQMPSPDCFRSTSVLAIATQMGNGMAVQNHGLDYKSSCRRQNISDTYSQKSPQNPRKRKPIDVLKFLSELTSKELRALIFAFEYIERKRTTSQPGQRLGAQHNPAKMQSCQYAAESMSCIAPQNSVNSVNGCEEICQSYPLTVSQRLQKERGTQWKGKNLQIAQVNPTSLTTNPKAFSDFMGLSNVLSMSNNFTQSENMNNIVFPNQGSHQHFHPMTEQAAPSIQPHKEHSVGQHDATTSHSSNQFGDLGADCNLESYSFNCLNCSTKNLVTLSSVNSNDLGSKQNNGNSHHFAQLMDTRNAADLHQTDTPDLKTNAFQYDEQSLKEIEALYNMLQGSYINKTYDHSKRQKVEAPSTTIQPSSSAVDHMNGFIGTVQSFHGNQAADNEHGEHASYINVLNHSAHSHSRAFERQEVEVALPKRLDEKESTPLKQLGDKTDWALIRLKLHDSTDQVKNSVFSNLPVGMVPECSSVRSKDPQPTCKMDAVSSPQSITKKQQTRGYPASDCTPASASSHKNLAFISEELSRVQKDATKMVHFSNAGLNDQKGDLSVLKEFPDRGIVSPVPTPILSSGQSDHFPCDAGSDYKASIDVPAGHLIGKMSSASDICTINDSKICNSSPERVSEKLTLVSNPDESLAKESDTLEFILRSLGIIPENNEGGSTEIPTSLIPSAEVNTKKSFQDNISCIELQQNTDVRLPPIPQSEKQNSVDSTDWTVSTNGSTDAMFNMRETQYKLNALDDPLHNDNTVGKLKLNGMNQLSSLHQSNIQVKGDQNAIVLSSVEDGLLSKTNGTSNTETQLAVASIQAGTEGCENLLDNPSSDKIKMHQHTAAIQFKDVRWHNDSSPPGTENHLPSSPVSSSPVGVAHLTRINTASKQPVDLGGDWHGNHLGNTSNILSLSKMPVISVNMVRNKKNIMDRHFDSCIKFGKQQNPAPQNVIMEAIETMGMSNSLVQVSDENKLLDRKESFRYSNSTQGEVPWRNAEVLSADDTLNCDDCIALAPPHSTQGVLRKSPCTIPASGIHSLLHNSNDVLKPIGMTVGQECLDKGCLVQEEARSRRTAVVPHKTPEMGLPSGIRITFVYSLSEYCKDMTSINSIISGSLGNNGQELQRYFRKVCNFSVRRMKQKAKLINGKGLPSIGTNLGVSSKEDHVTELSSQDIVPSKNNSSIHLGDMFTTMTNQSVNSFHPEMNKSRIPADNKHASEFTASANISKSLPGNLSCNNSSAEDCTNAVDKESSALCCLSSRETMNQSFFRKDEFHMKDDFEMSTESILRFWSPSKECTEMHCPIQEPENGLGCECGICSRLGMYTAGSEEELNESILKLSTLHHFQFDFTSAVNGSQFHGEISHPHGLYNQCNEGEKIGGVSGEPKLVERAGISHLLTDEDKMGKWMDATLLKVPLEPCSPKSYLQSSSEQMSNKLGECASGDNENEAGKSKMTLLGMNMNERRNSTHENHELINQGKCLTALPTWPFRDEESLKECEPNVDLSSEIKLKVLEHEEFNSVLSELSNSIFNPVSIRTEKISEDQSPETHGKTVKNSYAGYLNITGHELMETSAMEYSATSNSRTPSLSTVGSSPQY